MKTLGKAVIVLGLLIGSSICAMAGPFNGGVTWTFNNVNFSNGNTVTGWFVTNYAATQDLGYNIVVSGPAGSQAFTANVFVDAYLPQTIGFALNPGFDPYAVLYLVAPGLTGTGGTVFLGPNAYGDYGYDCGPTGGCGVVVAADDPYVFGVVPEPSALLIVGSSLGILGTMLRRKLGRA